VSVNRAANQEIIIFFVFCVFCIKSLLFPIQSHFSLNTKYDKMNFQESNFNVSEQKHQKLPKSFKSIFEFKFCLTLDR
jgi:hypothetical protein